MPVDCASLVPGQQVSDNAVVLDASLVGAYVEAVGDRSGIYKGDGNGGLVPPMAVAAMSLRGVLDDLAIPSGAVHAGQELAFMRTVEIGETLGYTASVLQNSVRRGRRFLTVQLAATDARGRRVMTGKSTLVLPA